MASLTLNALLNAASLFAFFSEICGDCGGVLHENRVVKAVVVCVCCVCLCECVFVCCDVFVCVVCV